MKEEEARRLLKRYRLGQCTEKEARIIESWLQSLGKESSDQLNLNPSIGAGSKMLDKIERKIDSIEEKNSNFVKSSSIIQTKPGYFEWILKIAAIFLISISLYFIFNVFENEKSTKTQSFTTLENQLKTIYLPDGSIVWLKGDSRLEYPDYFSGKIRDVTLFGEAFFKIFKDPSKPFRITSQTFTTTVLGTSFNIRAYENDPFKEVAVVSGKVKVSLNQNSGEKQEIILLTNQKAVFSKRGNKDLIIKGLEEIEKKAYEFSKLDFNEMHLENIIKILNAEHSVNITIKNMRLKNCVISADLTGLSLEVSMEILSKAINAEYRADGKEIIISGKGCKKGN